MLKKLDDLGGSNTYMYLNEICILELLDIIEIPLIQVFYLWIFWMAFIHLYLTRFNILKFMLKKTDLVLHIINVHLKVRCNQF